MNRILAVRGQVVPVSPTPLTLHARTDRRDRRRRPVAHHADGRDRARLDQPEDVEASEDALTAIAEAELIVLGPGSLYTSLLPSLLIPAIRDAVLAASAPRIFVCNVATQEGETTGFDLAAHVEALVAHTSPDLVDIVLANNQLRSPGAGCDRHGDRRRARRRGPSSCAGHPSRHAGAAARSSTRSSTRPTPTITTRPASRRRSSPRSRARSGSGRRERRPDRPAGPPDVTPLRARPRDGAAGRAGRHRSVAAVRSGRPRSTVSARRRPAARHPSARLVHRLRRLGEGGSQPVAVRRGRRAAEHCRVAWLRGRFLARGSLSLAGGRTHLEFVVGPDEAPDARRAARRVRAAGVVADPPWPGRRDLEERRGGRDVPAPDRRGRGAPRGRGPAGLAGAARRAQSSPERRVGEPPAGGQRRRPAARRDRRRSMPMGGCRTSPTSSGSSPTARRETPEASLAELAERLEIHRSAVQRALERLERLATLEGAPRSPRPVAWREAAPLCHDWRRCAT